MRARGASLLFMWTLRMLKLYISNPGANLRAFVVLGQRKINLKIKL
jgi:hypothetical protein